MRMRQVLLLLTALSTTLVAVSAAQSPQSSEDSHRKVLRKVTPQYPSEAKRINLGGTVKIVAQVAPDGSVKKVEALGGSPILVQAAETAVSEWKYAPGPESKETVELHFTP
ncbi:MAG TPA: energy transducer TonB [Candidatus Sulfotelmatobacter sp.]|nr:energy transducer TonB [Candidatus Sulfotelmatobacter sp.]